MVTPRETHFLHVRLMTFLLPPDGLDPQIARVFDFEEADAAPSLHYH